MFNDILLKLLSSSIPGFLLSMLIPLLFLIVMIRDKHSKYILTYFCWGLCAVVFAFVLNEWFTISGSIDKNLTSDIAPIVEESLKALPLLWFFRKKEYSSNLIIYCAMASGIGFSVQETLYYFTSFSASPEFGSLFPLLVRTFTTCLMHGMSTALIGYGITVTVHFKNIRIPMVLGLLALAATFHSLYNILIGTRLAVIALFMPVLLYFLGLALLAEDKHTEGGGVRES